MMEIKRCGDSGASDIVIFNVLSNRFWSPSLLEADEVNLAYWPPEMSGFMNSCSNRSSTPDCTGGSKGIVDKYNSEQTDKEALIIIK